MVHWSKLIDFIHKYRGIKEVNNTCTQKLLVLTHWGWDKMATISQTTFSNTFIWMKMFEFWLKFHWSLFLGVQLTIFQHWFRWWLGADQATSHYLNQWGIIYRCIYASLGFSESNCIQMILIYLNVHPEAKNSKGYLEWTLPAVSLPL